MKNKLLYLLVLFVLLAPFVSKAEKFCQEAQKSVPGKYLLFDLKKISNLYMFKTDPPVCLSGGKVGEVIPYVLTKRGTDRLYDEKRAYINGRDINCEVITKDAMGGIGLGIGEYYVKKCPDAEDKTKFYFDFNGQKSPLFKSFRSLIVSRDGKKLMAVLSDINPENIYGDPSNDKLLKIDGNKVSVSNNVANYVADNDLKDYAYLKKDGSNYALYYNGGKLHESVHGAQLLGFVVGIGPIFTDDGDDGKQAFYVGNKMIYQDYYIGKAEVVVSPDSKSYAYRAYIPKSRGNSEAAGLVVLNGKELPDSNYTSNGKEYGFSDDGSFYYPSCSAGRKNCVMHFKGKTIPTNDLTFSSFVVGNNGIVEIFGNVTDGSIGKIILNGMVMIEYKIGRYASDWFRCDISPSGKNIFCIQSGKYKGEGVAYFNKEKLPKGTASGYFTEKGDLITMDNYSLWESKAVYKNGKLFAAAGANERIITNNYLTDKVIAKIMPIMVGNKQSQMSSFKFYRNNKQIGGEYKGSLFIGGMDSEGGSFSVLYANDKFEVVREVIKIK